MATINIPVDKSTFMDILQKLDEQSKMEIYNELKKSLYLRRFNELLTSAKTDNLTLDDITKEVEAVRKQRFESEEQKH